MSWIPLVAWLAALVVTVGVLGFCAHELTWRAHRLQADLGQLIGLGDALSRLEGDATAAKRRLARPGAR